MTVSNTIHLKNKIIPEIIINEVGTALSYYPELANTNIEFKMKPSLNKSFMKAQPKLSSFFKSKGKREYIILISQTFDIDGIRLPLSDIPKDILIGWLGHELGHIMDYKNRSNFNLIGFGIRYFFSQNYIREAERLADTYAITHGMEKYILVTKRFILNNGSLPQIYKDRIKRLYLSPDEILLLVKELESK
ncbi:hypothetical protein U6A24_10625 [Aquimarina gracilis]|uniref:Peptidase M48-like protein n=1 Tax=Aquimarina gracilis TaxID=874422 RepID=A0ABU5ZVN1_9FLAO|nr:hypothetical protein [Aquimarina gracilis]MEB3345917.1 hypothetical protein [Aquimarina gracilis]